MKRIPHSPEGAPERPPHKRETRGWLRFLQGGLLLLVLSSSYPVLILVGQSGAQATPSLTAVAPTVAQVVAPKEAAEDEDFSPKKSKKKEKGDPRPSHLFFAPEGPIPTLIIQLEPEEWEYLKKDQQRYAEATLWEKGSSRVWKNVAVKTKGSAGSRQSPEQRPGLTISMKKYQGAEAWHGFQRWHLNNGAQDASLLNEQISNEMARMAGVPASRCSHALLRWQGRDLGLYLFKEAFDKSFLAYFYKDPNGDLYDGGFVKDLEANMEKDDGDPYQRENIKELIAAAKEGNQEKRWERLEKILNVDQFISFLAIEALTCHWDGYNFNKNNYRVYFDKTSGKAEFFLHGTDQTFNDANAAILREPGSMIGVAVMSNPAWKKAYRERVEKIYYEVLKPVDWAGRVTEVGAKVKAALAEANPEWAKQYESKINETRARVVNRIAAVGKQLGDIPKPVPLKPQSPIALGADGWRAEGNGATADTATREGKESLHLRTEGETSASWRKNLQLDPGRYRFFGRVATAGVVGSETPSGTGAGLRISGGSRTTPNSVVGDAGWKDVSFEFDSTGGETVLVAELRASKGEVWFDRSSLQLLRVQ